MTYNEDIKNVFDELKRSNNYVNLYDLIDWFDTTELILNEMHIQVGFVYSKMPIPEELDKSGKSILFIAKI